MWASGTLLRWQMLITVRASGDKHIISTACWKNWADLLLGPESVIFFHGSSNMSLKYTVHFLCNNYQTYND